MKNLTMINMLFILIVILPLTIVASSSNDKKIIIAVIDTGFGYEGLGKQAKLCKFGHKDFTTEYTTVPGYNTVSPIPKDFTGHGTNIVGIIDSNIQYTNYCIVIIKYFSLGSDNLKSSIKAIEYATNIKADYINYSSNGSEYSIKEATATKKFLDGGGIFVAAAGNEGQDLTKHASYPGMSDSRIVLVGNKDISGKKHSYSNYGTPITVWENGVNLNGFGIVMTGTSQATAKVTGKMVNQRLMDYLKK